MSKKSKKLSPQSINMGRPRKPVALKKIDGTFRADRQSGTPVPEHLETLPTPPAHLNAAAASIWDEYGNKLQQLGILTPIDLILFESFCIETAMYRECTEIINSEGAWIEEKYAEGGIKSIKRHPASMIRNAALANMRSLAARFGLDPHSRQAIETEVFKDDEFDRL